MPWEEVAARVLQALLCKGCYNPLVPLPALLCGQVGVEIADLQQRAPLGLLADVRDKLLYGQGVVWGHVEPRNIPPPVS